MPIAKETLRIGFVTVALPGTYVTKEAVTEYGWGKLVDDGPDIGGDTVEANGVTKAPAKSAPKTA